MKFSRNIILGGLLCLMLFSCGKQHKAEGVVNDFIDANITLADYHVEFSPIDSTNRISAERIAEMKRFASNDKLFKRNAASGFSHADSKYVYTRAMIINGQDTVVRTFYLDAAITKVIAFKEN